MIQTRGYATHSPTSTLEPFNFERRDPGPHDVLIEILYCGVCHSDIHQARDALHQVRVLAARRQHALHQHEQSAAGAKHAEEPGEPVGSTAPRCWSGI